MGKMTLEETIYHLSMIDEYGEHYIGALSKEKERQLCDAIDHYKNILEGEVRSSWLRAKEHLEKKRASDG